MIKTNSSSLIISIYRLKRIESLLVIQLHVNYSFVWSLFLNCREDKIHWIESHFIVNLLTYIYPTEVIKHQPAINDMK